MDHNDQHKSAGARRQFSPGNSRVVSYCPLCDSNYNLLEAKILEQREDAQLVYIKCRTCASSILALILAHPLGVSTVGLLTDLSINEVYKYRAGQPISEDDVLNIYQDLQNFDNVIHFCR